MLEKLDEFSEQVRTCGQRAEDAKRKAERTADWASKIHFLKMETRWLALARSYELTGVISANLDRRGQFEERARASERREPQKVVEGTVDTISQLVWLASIVESGDDAILGTNLDGIITSWNKGAERLFGHSAEEAIGQPAAVLIPPERRREENVILERIRRGDRVDHCETVRRRKDGTLIDVSLTISPIRGAGGKVVGGSAIARDISERKRSEAQIAVLSREAEHRAKNLLANVKAMVRLSQSDTLDGLKKAIEGRIDALANVHSLFVKSRWTGAELRSLVEQELSPFDGGEMRTLINGPSVVLKPDAAQAMAIALHELATNAAKYGALSMTTGQVRVEWWHVEDGQLVLRWTEAGGPPVKSPARKGFGTHMMEAMIRDGLKGRVQLDWHADGLACEIAVAM